MTTVYTSGIDIKIDRRVDGARLFEGKAEAVSRSNKLPYLVPNLVEAMFTGFPGKFVPIADTITVLFCGSQKSLANGAPIARILFAGHPALGLIILPLILYHQTQLVVCTLLAQRFAARSDD